MQIGKVISDISRHIRVHEKNYPTHDLKLVIVLFFLLIYHQYHYSVHVDVFTNDKIL